jgi:putative membrane protein
MSQPPNPYESFEEEELILRDELAIDRTVLANERTFLAYVRTALAFGIVGGTCLRFLDSLSYRIMGTACCVIAAGVLGIGAWRAALIHRRVSVVRAKQRANAERRPHP